MQAHLCVCVGAYFTIFVGSENQEPIMFVGSDSFLWTKMLDSTGLNGCLSVKTWFSGFREESF